jgi:uncharacterized membrane protein
MKVMKIMSTIGVIGFPVFLVIIYSQADKNIYSSVALSLFVILFAFVYSLVVFKSNYMSTKETNIIEDLLKLNGLKEKGVVTEDEFQAIKNDLMNKKSK